MLPLKLKLITPEQKKVVALGLCAKCYTRDLRPVGTMEGLYMLQCPRCSTVWGIPTVLPTTLTPAPSPAGWQTTSR